MENSIRREKMNRLGWFALIAKTEFYSYSCFYYHDVQTDDPAYLELSGQSKCPVIQTFETFISDYVRNEFWDSGNSV